MKNLTSFPLFFTLVLIVLTTAGCKKEETPPVQCFSFGQRWSFDALNTPIDSVVLHITNDGGDHPETRTYVFRNMTIPIISGSESCGLFNYRMEVYNSASNPPLTVIFDGDNRVFRTETFTGSTVIEGTYVFQ